jgi:hypothetical protein
MLFETSPSTTMKVKQTNPKFFLKIWNSRLKVSSHIHEKSKVLFGLLVCPWERMQKHYNQSKKWRK